MSNVSKKFFVRLNHYDTAIVNPVIKPAQGDLAAMRLTDGRFGFKTVLQAICKALECWAGLLKLGVAMSTARRR
mgnify:CR=1 FL=1